MWFIRKKKSSVPEWIGSHKTTLASIGYIIYLSRVFSAGEYFTNVTKETT